MNYVDSRVQQEDMEDGGNSTYVIDETGLPSSQIIGNICLLMIINKENKHYNEIKTMKCYCHNLCIII